MVTYPSAGLVVVEVHEGASLLPGTLLERPLPLTHIHEPLREPGTFSTTLLDLRTSGACSLKIRFKAPLAASV